MNFRIAGYFIDSLAVLTGGEKPASEFLEDLGVQTRGGVEGLPREPADSTGAAEPENTEAEAEIDGRFPSDHLPVVADVQVGR